MKDNNTDVQINKARSKGLSPLQDYNNRGDVVELLKAHKWTVYNIGSDDNNDDTDVYLKSPDEVNNFSATFTYSDGNKRGGLRVYKETPPFESGFHSPSDVFAILECNGDKPKARQKLLSLGYGEADARFSPKDETLQQDLESEDFNFYSDDFTVSPSRLARFYEKQGFIKIDVDENANPIVIKNENKILKPYNVRNKIISFLKNNIRHEDKRTELETLLIKHKTAIYDSFLLLDEVPLQLNRDTKDTIYIPFKNGVAKITADGMKMIPYESNELGLFMEVESLNHEFKEFDFDNRQMGDFERFLLFAITGREATTEDLTGDELTTVRAFFSMIGYLISNYKDHAQTFAIILSDEGANDEDRNGGRGKSLLTDAIKQVRKEKYRGGDAHATSYIHKYNDLQPYHDLYILDDVPKTFNFDSLYTDITGDIKAERKGTTTETIPFKDVAKFVITTNWAVPFKKEATSTNRRFAEFKFSDYWNNENTPVEYFGKRFFEDWDSDEWSLFFQFLCICSSHFLRVGLQKIDYSKEADNFRAYFSNDYILDTFERIWDELKYKKSFTVSDFLSEFNKLQLSGKDRDMFHRNNARKFIDAYLEFHKLPFEYGAGRKWNSVNDESVSNDISQLPF